MNLVNKALLSLVLTATVEAVTPADQGTPRGRKLTAHEVGMGLKERTRLDQGDISNSDGYYADSDGREYHVTTAKAKTVENRIRLHNDGEEEVASVSCIPAEHVDGKSEVVLTLKEAIEEEDLDDIFPVMSLVIIEGDDYGHCELGFTVDEGTAGEIQELTDDAYIYVFEHELSSDGLKVTLRGKAANFFAQFEEIELDVELVADRRRELEHIKERHRELGVEDDGIVSHRELRSTSQIIRDANRDAANAMKNSDVTPTQAANCGAGETRMERRFEMNKFCASASAEICMNAFDSGIRNFRVRAGVRVGWWSIQPWFDIRLQSITDFKTEAALSIGFDDCTKTAEEIVPITGKILLMNLNLHAAITAVDYFGGLDLPGYTIGIYAQLNYVVQGNMSLKNGPRITTGLGYELGREVKEYYVKMDPGRGIESGEILREYRAGRGLYTIFEQQGSRMELDADIFMGIRPVIGIYTRTFQIEGQLDFGILGELKMRGPQASSLSAVASCGSQCSTVCRSNHYHRLGVKLQAKDMKVDVKLFIDILGGVSWDDITWERTFDILQGPFLDIPLAMLCFGADDQMTLAPN